MKISKMLSTRNILLQESFDNFDEDEAMFSDLNEIKQEIEFEVENNRVKIEMEKPKPTQMRIGYRDATQNIKKNDSGYNSMMDRKEAEHINK